MWAGLLLDDRDGNHMGWLDAIVLGIVQGLTEFLPISSSAHVSIIGQLLLDGRDPGAAFTAVTQLGTETAVLVYFWRDIVRIITAWFGSLTGRVDRGDPDARMGWLVIVGSIPIVILGLLLEGFIETTFRSLWVTVSMLAGVAIVLFFADKMGERNTRTLDKLTWGHGIIFGLAQAAALIPGVSRSGGTISAGLFMGYNREAATRYSFLLAIPAVFGSGLYKLTDIGAGSGADVWGPTIVATIIAFFVGYAVIAWLIKFISTHTFRGFVYYRLGLAAVVAVLLLTGVLQA